jgi:putative sigma-54 modulation protein
METQILFKNMEIDEEMKEYASKKLSRLQRYLNNIKTIKMEISEEKSKSRKHAFNTQVTINVNGFLIRGERKDATLRACIDGAVETMERLVNKYKSKYEVNKGRQNRSIRIPEVSDELDTEGGKEDVADPADVVKIKRFHIKPMTVEQAIDQMEFIGHDFFIFINAEDKSFNIVYRRKNGQFGLIIPEIS